MSAPVAEVEYPALASANGSRTNEPSASARKLAAVIVHRTLAIGARVISERSGIGESSISRIISEQQGVLLTQLQPFLLAYGLKVVPSDHICVDPKLDAAKTLYAEMGMRCEREHRHSPAVAPELDWNS